MQEPHAHSPWQAWAMDVQGRLSEQQRCIDKLKEQVDALCARIQQLESRPTYNIEKIEYKFDQLKVEQLDGTLNIGMTTPGPGDQSFPGEIEQLSVPEQQQPQVFPAAEPAAMPQPASPLYPDLMNEMNRYLDTEAVRKLSELELELGMPLDSHHRKLIIEDIRKQIPNRIQYYAKQAEQAAPGPGESDLRTTSLTGVLSKTKRDTDAALLAYLRHLQGAAPAGGT